MKRVCKIFKEKNGEVLIDLAIKEEDGVYFIDDEVHGISIENCTHEEVNEKLHDMNISEDVKLEIKKVLLGKHMGVLEVEKDRLEKKINSENVALDKRKEMEVELLDFEEKVVKDLKAIGEKINNLLR